MKNDLRQLFFDEKYKEAEKAIRLRLDEKPDDPELLYSLFLANNGNYIDIDFDNVGYKKTFKKAVSLANKREKEKYESEYNLYKSFSTMPYMRKMFRYAELDNYEAIKLIMESVDDSPIVLDADINRTEFYSNLDYSVSSEIRAVSVDLNLVLVNLLYIKTNHEECIKIIENLSEMAAEFNSSLAPYVITTSIDELKSKLDSINKKEEPQEPTIEDINTVIEKIEKCLKASDFIKASELVELALINDETNVFLHLFKAASLNGITALDELYMIHGLNKDEHFLNAYKYASDELRADLDEQMKYSYFYDDYTKGIELMEKNKHFGALECFTRCIEFPNADEKYNICFEAILSQANSLEIEERLEEALTLLNKLNEYNTVENDIERVKGKLDHVKYLKAYDIAASATNASHYLSAIAILEEIDYYSDSKELIEHFKAMAENFEKKDKNPLRSERKFTTLNDKIFRITSAIIAVFFFGVFIAGIFPSKALDNVIIINTILVAITTVAQTILCKELKPIHRVLPVAYFFEALLINASYHQADMHSSAVGIYTSFIGVNISIIILFGGMLTSAIIVNRKIDIPYLTLGIASIVYYLIYIFCRADQYYYFLAYIPIIVIMLVTKDRDNHGQAIITSYILVNLLQFYGGGYGILYYTLPKALPIDIFGFTLLFTIRPNTNEDRRIINFYTIVVYGIYMIKLFLSATMFSIAIIIGSGDIYAHAIEMMGRLSFMVFNINVLITLNIFLHFSQTSKSDELFDSWYKKIHRALSVVIAFCFIFDTVLLLYRTFGVIFNYSNFESITAGVYSRGSLWNTFGSLAIDVTLLFSVFGLIVLSFLYVTMVVMVLKANKFINTGKKISEWYWYEPQKLD